MVPEHGSTFKLDRWCVGHAFILIVYVFSYICSMGVFLPFCVGHGGSGVTMKVMMMLLSTCCHVCVTDGMFSLFIYYARILVYMLYILYVNFLFRLGHYGSFFYIVCVCLGV